MGRKENTQCIQHCVSENSATTAELSRMPCCLKRRKGFMRLKGFLSDKLLQQINEKGKMLSVG